MPPEWPGEAAGAGWQRRVGEAIEQHVGQALKSGLISDPTLSHAPPGPDVHHQTGTFNLTA